VVLEDNAIVDTCWCVLTGAPGTGKTTLLSALHGLKFKVVPETARTYFAIQQALGKSILEITGRQDVLQPALVAAQSVVESSLDPRDCVFLDRALPDALGYYRIAEMPTATLMPLFRYRYRHIFALEPIPEIGVDPYRLEDAHRRADLGDRIISGYRELGYHIHSVPAMSLTDRLSYVLEHAQVVPRLNPTKE
jgi:predicted ATPase